MFTIHKDSYSALTYTTMEKIIESSNDMSATSTEKSDTFRGVNSASETHDLIDSKKTADGEHLPKEEKISIEKSNDIENNFFFLM